MVTYVIVPGLRDHVAEHWQTLLAARLPRSVTVPPLEHDKLSLVARIAALDRTLAQVEGPVMLVAHSAGVMIAAHWAQLNRRPVAGALFATPADLEEPLPAGYPTMDVLRQHGWLPIPRAPLPFLALVAASRNDPLARFERVAGYARDWRAGLADIGDAGHLNPAAGYGEWPGALDLIDQVMSKTKETSK